MTFAARLRAADARSTAELEAVIEGGIDEDALALACHDPETSDAASWIVKALAERGESGDLDLAHCLSALHTAENWPTQLHLLQTIQHAPDAALEIASAVLNHLNAEKTLVRVWAMDALVHLATHQPNLRPSATQHLTRAQFGPASLTARAKHLDKVRKSWDHGT